MDTLTWKASISRPRDRPPCASRARVNKSFMRSPHVWSFFQCTVTGQKHAYACIDQKSMTPRPPTGRGRGGQPGGPTKPHPACATACAPGRAPAPSLARSVSNNDKPGIRDCRSTEANHRGETGGHGGADPGRPHRAGRVARAQVGPHHGDEGTAQPEDAGDQEVLDP